MIYFFDVVSKDGSRDFGIVDADSAEEGSEYIEQALGVKPTSLSTQLEHGLIAQYGGVALLKTAVLEG